MNTYGAQSLQQLLGSIAQLTQQQQQNRRDYTPQQPAANSPQTPMQGLISGLVNEHNRRREDARSMDQNAIQQAVALLDLIPDSQENAPKKLQLLTSILHPKTQKGWKEILNPEADHSYQAQMLSRISGMIPNEEEAQQQQGIATATRPRTIADAGSGYVPTSRKFEFPDEDQYYPPQIIVGKDGNLKSVQLPRRGNGKPIVTDLGEGQTSQMATAEIRAQAATRTPAQNKQLHDLAGSLAEADGKSYSELSSEEQAQYRQEAGILLKRKAVAQTQYAELRPEIGQAVINEKNANAGRGGITAGQDVQQQQARQQALARADAEVSETQAEVTRHQTQINEIWNGYKTRYPDIAGDSSQLYLRMRKDWATLAELNSKLQAAHVKAKAAQAARTRIDKTPLPTPREGSAPLTGNLDWDRVIRRDGGGSALAEDTGALDALIIDGKPYDYSTLPAIPRGQSSYRLAGDVYLLNPAQLDKVESAQPGAIVERGRVRFQIVRVLPDPAGGAPKIVAKLAASKSEF